MVVLPGPEKQIRKQKSPTPLQWLHQCCSQYHRVQTTTARLYIHQQDLRATRSLLRLYPKLSVESYLPTPSTQPTSWNFLSAIFFKKTHWHPKSMSLQLISPLIFCQNHWSPIMHYPSTTNPYGIWLSIRLPESHILGVDSIRLPESHGLGVDSITEYR